MAGEAATGADPDSDASTPRLTVGALLRAERERRNLTLDDVAVNLRIRRALLDAIEHGRFKELPGAPYAVGFVKAYAEFLELDRDEVIRRFKEEAAGLDSHKELNFPRPLSESRLPGGVLLLLSAVIAVGAYAFWYFQGSSDRALPPRVASVPERLAPLVDSTPTPQSNAPAAEAALPASIPQQPEGPVPTAAPETTTTPPASITETAPAPVPASAETASVQSTTDTGASPATASPPPSAPAEVAAIPTAPAETASAPRVFGESAASRIIIRATADSWIQVRDSSGTVIFTRVLRTGDSFNVPNRQGLSLYTGSAGALEISVDGKVAPSIGQAGTVRRDVMLDPERLLAGTAVLDQRRPASDPSSRPSTTPSGG